MTKTDLIFPAFSLTFADFVVQFFFRCKFYSARSDDRVRFDIGGIFLDQSQFFATHSKQRNCFILKRSKITSNGLFFVQRRGKRSAFALCWNILKKKAFRYYIKQKDSMLPCVCSVTDHRRRQNVVRTTMTHSATPRVPLFCSYHILTSSVIYYWTDARQHGIYLLTSGAFNVDHRILIHINLMQSKFTCAAFFTGKTVRTNTLSRSTIVLTNCISSTRWIAN